MKFILMKKASGKNYSLEAGLCDNVRNFDHHGVFSENPAPCNNENIVKIPEDSIIELTHIDADSYIGCLRMEEKELPSLDFSLMEKIDCNGSSVVSDKYNETLLYVVGVVQLAKNIEFPRVSINPIDVTDFIEKMHSFSVNDIINIGKEATKLSEQVYKNCCIEKDGNIGLWAVNEKQPFDPSRPYEDEIDIVVVYRSNYKSVSLYCSPKSEYVVGGDTFADIKFEGHDKACGSPRGDSYTLEDAKNVFNAVVKKFKKDKFKLTLKK